MALARLTIAAASLASMTAIAGAQGPSYESRGYGGPLYVGPNFQAGGQHSPPVYDSKPTTRERDRKRVNKAPAKRSTPAPAASETAKAPAKTEPQAKAVTENSSIAAASATKVETGTAAGAPQSENSTIARAARSSAETASTKTAGTDGAAPTPETNNVGCKKYFPTAGMTLSVPCE